jgi:hypothetical protein
MDLSCMRWMAFYNMTIRCAGAQGGCSNIYSILSLSLVNANEYLILLTIFMLFFSQAFYSFCVWGRVSPPPLACVPIQLQIAEL